LGRGEVRGVPKTPQPGFAGAEALARGNRLGGSPTKKACINAEALIMNSRILISFILALLIIRITTIQSAPFETLNKNFNRCTSRAMVRRVTLPTAANLDDAAWLANPVRFDPQAFHPKKPAKKITLAECTFGGAIASPCAALSQTPLTASEKEQPFAWDPLQNRIWELTKTDLLAKTTHAVNGQKWADSSIYSPCQEIACAYVHGSGDSATIWVRIEFKPWVSFTKGLVDENRDGFRECYGRIETDDIDKTLLDAVRLRKNGID